MKLALATIALAACTTTNQSVPDAASPTPDAAMSDFNASGSRIKLRYLETPDGAKLVTGLFDSQRSEDCSFRMASDGETHCLPVAPAAVGFYSDTSCSQPALELDSCAPAPKYLVAIGAVSCASAPPTAGPRIYKTGTASTSAYRIVGTTCTNTGVQTDLVFYALGAEVDPSEFASADLKTEP